MKIVAVRRIAQVFFLLLFLWFCVVSTFGTEAWQLRGWPVNWIMELDPLVGLGTLLSTHTLYRGLLWGLLTIALTLVFGRFFCGWVCPFGALHQFMGWLGRRGLKLRQRVEGNRYRSAAKIKYFVLIVFLFMAALPLGGSVSLQSGLLDPIPFLHRSVNLTLLAVADGWFGGLSSAPRQYPGAWLIGTLLMAALFLNLAIPRFYCRFICPLGALFGLLARYSIFRIGKHGHDCTHCKLCENHCEGACDPFGKIRVNECLLCMNCLESCPKKVVDYGVRESVEGQIDSPDFGRRSLILSAISGALAVPFIRLGGSAGSNWHHNVVRPPGSLPEEEFLERCIKCGQCMRVCPTNVIIPGGVDGGLENLWTPVLDFRNGTSGCQLNCTACSFICPTAAIRPLSLAEKLGVGPYAEQGPVRIGTAFVDHGRCLPWSMDTPCIVCQENCPVTPKAIYVKEFFNTVRDGVRSVDSVQGATVHLVGEPLKPGKYAGGDFYLDLDVDGSHKRIRIVGNGERSVLLEEAGGEAIPIGKGARVALQIKLQAPVVDIEKCIGCGICEHECPVSGLRAIRVSAENETRNVEHSLILQRRG